MITREVKHPVFVYIGIPTDMFSKIGTIVYSSTGESLNLNEVATLDDGLIYSNEKLGTPFDSYKVAEIIIPITLISIKKNVMSLQAPGKIKKLNISARVGDISYDVEAK